MKIFRPIYDVVMRWSRHPRAVRYLFGVSFIESSFFPVPTAVMLAPMVLADRKRAWQLATLTTVASVLGGLFGYAIGYFLFEQLGKPIIDFYGAEETFVYVSNKFNEYGLLGGLVAGVTPIPYKIFTISSGVFGFSLAMFIIASVIGRALQFFLIAGVLWWGGDKLEHLLKKWMELIGWMLIAIIAIVIAIYFILK